MTSKKYINLVEYLYSASKLKDVIPWFGQETQAKYKNSKDDKYKKGKDNRPQGLGKPLRVRFKRTFRG
jgi:hypothetical protein